MSRRKRGATQRRKPWQPLEQLPMNPQLIEKMLEAYRGAGIEPTNLPVAVYANDTYQVLVRENGGITHLSIHRHDRRAMRDWRHLQQIKNEVAGPERTGFEVFPPESSLVDTSNEYHLFVLPEGVNPPFLGETRMVMDAAESNVDRVAGEGLARQRPRQPGLT